jgi:hypothetical protein
MYRTNVHHDVGLASVACIIDFPQQLHLVPTVSHKAMPQAPMQISLSQNFMIFFPGQLGVIIVVL